ncbi:uncharacterized protein BDV14DRAFT_205208 [Aspergillus stella-maris]|uniref:uncharacterized protein n=1 Tax=Aspergillus stella-maris TaxID=1810926 RepID=UPI003CCCB902
MGMTPQNQGRREHPIERDLKQKRRDPLPFAEDELTDAERVLYPPLAWTQMWNEKYSNMYGYYCPRPCRSWGYVMWDAKRIRDTSAGKLLKKQLEKGWSRFTDDPRDSVDG